MSWSSKPADKNLGLCVISIDWHIDEGYRQMRAGNYERPFSFSMASMLSKLDTFLAAHSRSIDYTEGKWLRHQRQTGQFRLAVFYMLPKLHKDPIKGRCIEGVGLHASVSVDSLPPEQSAGNR